MTVQNVARLLERTRVVEQQERHEWSNAAARFNVFDALAIEDSELAHSRFLAFLLSPRQRHDQGEKFLRSFLELVGIRAPDDLTNADVLTETPIIDGRLDILLKLPLQFTVCIENKIWSDDQDDQVGKYLRWLNSSAVDTPIKVLIYLTPTGRKPKTGDTDFYRSQLRLLSYNEIADWLEDQYPSRLDSVIRMYLETCRRINGGLLNAPHSKELAELIMSNENFETALSVAEFIDWKKPRITEVFWGNVHEKLAARLTDSVLGHVWSACRYKEIRSPHSAIFLLPSAFIAATKNAGKDAPTCYAVGIAALSNNPEDCYYGIYRPEIERSQLDTEISKELRLQGFRDSKPWIFRKGADFGLPSVAHGGTEWFIKLNIDNNTTSNPLANQVADGMLELLLRLSARLDILNRL